jgi:hypothetical protein
MEALKLARTPLQEAIQVLGRPLKRLLKRLLREEARLSHLLRLLHPSHLTEFCCSALSDVAAQGPANEQLMNRLFSGWLIFWLSHQIIRPIGRQDMCLI